MAEKRNLNFYRVTLEYSLGNSNRCALTRVIPHARVNYNDLSVGKLFFKFSPKAVWFRGAPRRFKITGRGRVAF